MAIEINLGKVTGEAGYSPLIQTNANTSTEYTLDITSKNTLGEVETTTTPNLMGSGSGGTEIIIGSEAVESVTFTSDPQTQLNAINTTATSAYTRANSAYTQANSAYTQANSAYTKANSVTTRYLHECCLSLDYTTTYFSYISSSSTPITTVGDLPYALYYGGYASQKLQATGQFQYGATAIADCVAISANSSSGITFHRLIANALNTPSITSSSFTYSVNSATNGTISVVVKPFT